MHVALQGSYMEWGFCLFALWFCWWKYGWNMDVLKGTRQMYKKMEAILFNSDDLVVVPAQETSETKHFKRIPVTGSPFSPRAKATTGPCYRSFGDLLDNNVSEELLKPHQELCFVCGDPTKVTKLKEIKEGKPLKNCLDYETRGPSNPWYVRLVSDFAFWWRKWDIGPQYNVPTLKQMMGDERLKWVVREVALQEYREFENETDLQTLVDKHTQRVEEIVKRMRAKQPAHPWYSIYCRIAAWIIGKFLGQIYPKILVRDSQVELIHKARKSGYPILYLPVHKSHIDYVLLSWTLINCDLRTPVVAAGENLNIPVFSLLMKSVGGFFIQRRFETRSGKKDVVYRTLLHAYMRRALTNNNDMEFFIEGGRTRTGKPCTPKGGLLNIVMESLLSNKVEDIFVVPVNFSYDKIVEGNYIREQLGQPKVNESFASALLALFGSLRPKYGNAQVDYGHPFSMREFVMKQVHAESGTSTVSSSTSGSTSTSTTASDGDSTAGGIEEIPTDPFDVKCLTPSVQRKVVDALGRHALYEGTQCFTMTSTNAIAFLLLNKFRNGVLEEVLKKEIIEFKAELSLRGHGSTFSSNVEDALNHAVQILGPTLIRVTYRNGEKYICPVTDLPNVIELSYYSNSVLPVYAMESIIASSVFKILGELCNNNNLEMHEKIKETELVATCLEYANVLQNEFLLNPPCQPLASSCRRTIQFLSDQGVFLVSVDGDGEKLLEIKSSETLRRLVYLKNMLRPLLDAYLTASNVLKRLVDHEAEEKRLQMDMLAATKRQLQNKAMLFGESMTLDPIRNFVQRATHWQVLDTYKKDLKTIYYLHDDFNSVEAVEEIIHRLGKLRV